jgi:hypothetical protein
VIKNSFWSKLCRLQERLEGESAAAGVYEVNMSRRQNELVMRDPSGAISKKELLW